MTYETYKTLLVEKLRQEFKTKGEYEIYVDRIIKNNMEMDGLEIKAQDSKIISSIDIESYYRSDVDIEKACAEIIKSYERIPISIKEFFEISADYSKLKNSLQLRVVNKDDNNLKFLQKGIYRFNDVGAEIVYLELKRGEDYNTSYRVTADMLELYGLTEEEVFSDAIENTQKKNPIIINGIYETICEIIGEDATQDKDRQNDDIYVISNKEKLFGAAVLSYPDSLKLIRETVGEKFYILPSSIHEVLAVSQDTVPLGAIELREMVREINRTEVEPQDILSNEVFEYDAEHNRLKQCIIKEREKIRGRAYDYEKREDSFFGR